MPCGGEAAHVGTGLGHDHVSSGDADAGDGDDQVSGRQRRFHQLLDARGHRRDRLVVLVDQADLYPWSSLVGTVGGVNRCALFVPRGPSPCWRWCCCARRWPRSAVVPQRGGDEGSHNRREVGNEVIVLWRLNQGEIAICATK